VRAAGRRYPALVELTDPLIRSSFSVPDATVEAFGQARSARRTTAAATAAHIRREYDKAIDGYRGAGRATGARRGAVPARRIDRAEHRSEAIAELSAVVAEQPRNAEAHNSLGSPTRGSPTRPRRSNISLIWPSLPTVGSRSRISIAASSTCGSAISPGLGRLRMALADAGFLSIPVPTNAQWRGEDVSDKVMLVHTEQGSGDAMQFARSLPLAARRCRKLVLLCPENLKALMAGGRRRRGASPGDLPTGSFDVYCPLLSLPRALGITLESLPTTVPYLRVPPRMLVPDLAGDGFKVGLVGAGSPTQKDDHHRSCPLNQLLPLTDLPGVYFFSLQKPLGDGEAEMLEARGVVNLEKDGIGYAYTAACVEKLDLVVSVCTSVAHLAGTRQPVDPARALCRLALGYQRRRDSVVSEHAPLAST
jgi:hypothetical protein